MKLIKKLLILFVCLFLGRALHADIAEEIQSFHSDIVIGDDGIIDVTETIEVMALGQHIQQGIYRDISTIRRWNSSVDVTVISASLDGKLLPLSIKSRHDAVRVYMREDRAIGKGVHTFILHYRISGLVGFLRDWDEFSYNVTGRKWALPIQRASARVTLPSGNIGSSPRIEASAAYTGPFGSTEKDAEVTVAGGTAFVRTTGPLAVGEGLTFAVGWPSGIVKRPDASLWTSPAFVCALGAFLVIGLLYTMVPYRNATQVRQQTDPKLSPAEISYLARMEYHHTALASTLADLARKGYLGIAQKNGRYSTNYQLRQTRPLDEQLSAAEAGVLSDLFPDGPGYMVVVDESGHDRLENASQNLRKALEKRFKGLVLTWPLARILGALFSVGVILATFISLTTEARGLDSQEFWVATALLGLIVGIPTVLFSLDRSCVDAPSKHSGLVVALVVAAAAVLLGMVSFPLAKDCILVGLLVVTPSLTYLNLRHLSLVKGEGLLLRSSVFAMGTRFKAESVPQEEVPAAIALGMEESTRFKMPLRPSWYLLASRKRGVGPSFPSAIGSFSSAGSSGGGYSGCGGGGGGGGGC